MDHIKIKIDKKDLDDIIRLKVPANVDQKEQEKSYTYSQLIELNDKLTLVVGKEGKQQEIIKYFSDVKLYFKYYK